MLLLVDGDPRVARALADLGVEMRVAVGGLARLLARRHVPTVIVVGTFADLELLRQSSPSSLLILLTSAANDVERIAAFACGVDGYIVRSELAVLRETARACVAVTSDDDLAMVQKRRMVH
jgi:hypothetical protein